MTLLAATFIQNQAIKAAPTASGLQEADSGRCWRLAVPPQHPTPWEVRSPPKKSQISDAQHKPGK